MSLLFAIQADLLENPKLGDVMPGTNGARKARVADRTNNRGKSGSFRYIYVFLQNVGIVYLLLLYAKNEAETLTAEETKIIGNLVKELKGVYKEK